VIRHERLPLGTQTPRSSPISLAVAVVVSALVRLAVLAPRDAQVLATDLGSAFWTAVAVAAITRGADGEITTASPTTPE
jgi:hypothetical protein